MPRYVVMRQLPGEIAHSLETLISVRDNWPHSHCTNPEGQIICIPCAFALLADIHIMIHKDMARTSDGKLVMGSKMDEQKDNAEEMYNAMTPFRENMRYAFGPGWNSDQLLIHLQASGFGVDKDNDGQIIINTGLYEAPDGSLWRDP